ncbi:MAG: two-component regulator propeller domain-containing protein [Deltaproteobacteria bacterium]|nr:two-component regulator propeller domain-containing protein [Deltaproteobacteria bacterium]
MLNVSKWDLALGFLLVVAWPATAMPAGEQRSERGPIAPFAFQQGEVWQASQKVFALAQTSDGFLWAGTDSGLIRYDGRDIKKFTSSDTYGLRENIVTALATDKGRMLWLGLEGGRGLAGMRNDRVEWVAEGHALQGHSITALVVDELGVAWAGTKGGLFRYDHSTSGGLERYAAWPGGEVFVLAPAADGNGIWVAGSQGLFRARNSGIERYAELFAVSALVDKGGGELVVADASAGLLRVQANTTPSVLVAAPPGSDGTKFSALAMASDGRIWAGWGTGAGILTGNTITPVLETRSEVVDLLCDQEGNTWAASFWGLVYKAIAPRVAFTSQPDKLPVVFGVTSDEDGAIWAAQFMSVTRIDPTTGTNQRWDSGTSFGGWCPRGAMRAAEGGVWFPTCDKGLFRFSAGKWHHPGAKHPERAQFIHSLFESGDGQVWIGTGLGEVFAMDKGGATTHHTLTTGTCLSKDLQRRPGVREECGFAIVAITEDKEGTIWAASRSAGLHRIQGNSTRTFTVNDGLPTNNLTALLADGNDLWIGTQGNGLVRYRQGAFATAQASAGLPGSSVHGILQDAEGWLWLTTEEGVVRANKADVEAYFAHTRHDLGASLLVDGHGSNPFIPLQGYPGVIHRTESGTLLVPTDHGILWVATERISQTKGFASPHLEFVRLQGAPQNTNTPHRVDLPVGVEALSSLSYKIVVPNFTASHRIVLRYRLRGHETTWRQANSEQPIEYLAVPAGEYTFEALAVLDGQAWAPPLLAPQVTVTSFRQRPVFFVLLGLLIFPVLGVVYVVRLHAKQLASRRVAHERNRIARELHDSLAQYLNGITMQLERSRTVGCKSPGLLDEIIDYTQSLVARCLQEARQSIQNLRQHEDHKTDLQAAITLLAEQVLTMTAAQNVEVKVSIRGTPKLVDYETHCHILRMAQEATMNALLHAKASVIEISLHQDRHHLTLSVEDNGRGIDHSQKERPFHFGLRGMQERAESVGGELTIGERPTGGTLVKLRV